MALLFILLILAAVQALAEFLPVSSSGHLVLAQSVPWVRDSIENLGGDYMLFINVALHIATLVAVIIFMRADVARLILGAWRAFKTRKFDTPEMRSILFILAASVPAALLGLLFHDFLEGLFSSPRMVFFLLIINGAVLLSTKIMAVGSRKLEEMGIVRSLLVGLFQALAILPGISRSGFTITGGFLTGMAPVEAARFSFLMAVPVIAGAGLLESVKAAERGLPGELVLPLLAAMVLAVLLGLFALRLLMMMVKRIRIDVFGYYTIAVGTAGLVLFHVL